MIRFLYGRARFARPLPAFLAALLEFLIRPPLRPVSVRTDSEARRLRGMRAQYRAGYPVQR